MQYAVLPMVPIPTAECPDEIVIEGWKTYTLRRYTPKRRGQVAGHGWVRDEPCAEVGAEVRALLDEIARLRGLLL